MSGIVRKGSKGVFARRAAQLQKELGPIAKKVEGEALGKAREGLLLNVYNTAPGNVYQRSGLLLASLTSSSQASGTSASITLEDNAPYASMIEFGTGPHAMSQQQLDQYLAALPAGRLVTFGRSGQAYMLPGPYLGPAMWYARARIGEEVRVLIRRLWR